jgi:hypothetical protein
MPEPEPYDTSEISFDPSSPSLQEMRKWQHKYDMKYIWSFNLDHWMPQIGDFTVHRLAFFFFYVFFFSSRFVRDTGGAGIPVSVANLAYICGVYQEWEQNNLPFTLTEVEELFEDERIVDLKKNIIATLQGQEEVFVRLSSRSPKDAPGGLKPCQSSSDILIALCRSRRVYLDCAYALQQQLKLKVWIFPWRRYLIFV